MRNAARTPRAARKRGPATMRRRSPPLLATLKNTRRLSMDDKLDNKLKNAAELIVSYLREPDPDPLVGDTCSKEPQIWGFTMAHVAVAVCRAMAETGGPA